MTVYLDTIFANQKPIYYESCPECKKKVLDSGQNMWRCEKCAKTLSEVKYMYNFSISVYDQSESLILNVLGDEGADLLGITATELKEIVSDVESDEAKATV